MQFYVKKKTNKKNKLDQKMGGRSKWTFLQRRHRDRQKAYEKILNIANY